MLDAKAPTKKREANIELLRMIFMAMIVMLHVLKRTGLLDTSSGLKYEVAWILEILSYASVNGFLIIAGWVNLNNRFKLSRIGKLWGQAVFWVLLFNVIGCAADRAFSLRAIIGSFFPFSTRQYWFYTYFFILMFFMPFLNRMVRSLKKNTCIGLFGTVLVVFSVIPFIYRQVGPLWTEDIFYVQRGYSLIWFLAVYVLGALLRRMHDLKTEEGGTEEGGLPERAESVRFRLSGRTGILFYFIGTAATYLLCRLCRSAGVYEYAAVSYASPLIVMSAIALFLFFRTVRVRGAWEKAVLFLAPGTFGVYLIHSNANVVPVFIRGVARIAQMRIRYMVPSLFLVVLIVMFVCLLMDLARGRLFQAVRLNAWFEKLDRTRFQSFFE